MQDFADLEHDPQVAHAGLIQTVPHPDGGDVRVVGVPVRFGTTPGAIRTGPPAVGQHTDEVLGGLGYSGDQLRAWHQEGVV